MTLGIYYKKLGTPTLRILFLGKKKVFDIYKVGHHIFQLVYKPIQLLVLTRRIPSYHRGPALNVN